MPFLETAALLSTILGGAGSLLGSGLEAQKLHPEVRRLLEQLYRRSSEGYGDKALSEMRNRLKTQLGNEFGAASSATQDRLVRQGAGAGVQNSASNRLNTERFKAVGSGIADIDIANEQQKMQALQMIGSLTNGLGYEQTGQGYGQLFGAGLNYLMNAPGMGGGTNPTFDAELRRLRDYGRTSGTYQIPSTTLRLGG